MAHEKAAGGADAVHDAETQIAQVAQRVRTLYRKLHLDRRTSSLTLKLV